MASLSLDANTLAVIGGWDRCGQAMKPVSGCHYAIGPCIQAFTEAFSSGEPQVMLKGLNDLGLNITWQSAFRYFGNPVEDTENQLGTAAQILAEGVRIAGQLGLTGQLHSFTARALGIPATPGRPDRPVWLKAAEVA